MSIIFSEVNWYCQEYIFPTVVKRPMLTKHFKWYILQIFEGFEDVLKCTCLTFETYLA